MAFIDKLKAVFIVPEEGDGKKLKNVEADDEESMGMETVVPQKKEVTTMPQNSSGGSSSTPMTGSVDAGVTETLLRAIEASNLPGFDYIEFKQGLKSLENMPMDEATRYRSAFAMAQTMGLTADKLLQSIQHYVGVLDTEENKFGQALQAQGAQRLTKQQEDIATLEKAIKDKTAMLQKLSEEIAEHQQVLQERKKLMDDVRVKIDSARANFDASMKMLKTQLAEDSAKIQQFLK